MIRYVCMTLLVGLLALSEAGAGPAQNRFRIQDGDTIVFLGDSITQAASRPEGYITLFDLFCGVCGYEVTSINAGISGHKSNQMLARLDKDVLAFNPDWVSVSCGVNDVWHGERGVPLPEYKKNMTAIVERCRDAGANVLLLTATPIFEDLDSPENRTLADYNAFLRDLAKEKNLLLCDLNQAFQNVYRQKRSDARILTTDGVHMKPRGYRLMAREILRSLGATGRELSQTERRWELQNNMCKAQR